MYSKRQENSRRQKENSSQLTENSLESSQTEVRKSSQAANDIFGGQAASHETSSENLEPHFQTESQHAGTNQDRHDDGFRDPGEPDEHEDGNQENTADDQDDGVQPIIPALLRGFPQYTLATNLLNIEPSHYGFLAGLNNSMTFIPEKYVKKTRKVFTIYMQRMIDDSTDTNWKKFILLSPILFDNDGNKLLKDRKSLLMEKLVKLEADDWTSFTIGSLSQRSHREAKPFSDAEINKAAMRFMKVGEIGKAFSKLKQDRRRVAPSAEVFQKLQDKHPPAGDSGLPQSDIDSIFSYDINRDDDVQPISVDWSDISSVLSNSRHLVAHGLDKTRYEHLKKLCAIFDAKNEEAPDVQQFRKLFTIIIAKIVKADVPQSIQPIFHDSESIALPKNENDIRPIGLQMIYRKIAGTICNRATKEFNEEYFENLQYCTTKGGTEIIAHSFRAAFDENPDYDIFAMDGSNSFNSENRIRGLFEVRKHFPAMLPFLRMLYGSSSTAWYYGLPGGIEGIKCEEGVHQGCVNAMWLYSMTIHPFLQGLRDILGADGFNKFFADDGNIAASTEKMAQCIVYIFQEGPKYGYFLNREKGTYLLGKCESNEVAEAKKQHLVGLGLNPAIIKFHPDNDPDHVSEYGAKMVGSYLGSEVYVKHQLALKLESLKTEAEVIKSFPDAQSQNLMFRYCFCQKINYLQRLTPPPLIADFVSKFDDLKREIFETIVQMPIEDSIWRQCALDIQNGGLSYQRTHQVTTVAYIASVFEAKWDIENLFPDFLSTSTCFMATAFHTSCEELQRLSGKPIEYSIQELASLSAGRPPGSTFQNYLNDQIKEFTVQNFLDSVQDTKRLAWIDSLRNDHSIGGRWLEVCPKTEQYKFTPDEFRTALRYRLYLNNPAYIEGSHCSCKPRPYVDPRGHHLATGCGIGGTRQQTHDGVANVLKDMLNSAGLMTRREEVGCFREVDPDDNHRPDISVTNMPGKVKKLILDVAVTCPVPLRSNFELSRNMALSKSHLANQAYNKKMHKYQALCEANNLEFLPLIFESTGGMHSKAAEHFFKVIDLIVGKDDKGYKICCHLFWAARLSCCLQKSIAKAIISKSRVINGHLTSERSYEFTPDFIGNFPVAKDVNPRR